jgi:hypothetical protein
MRRGQRKPPPLLNGAPHEPFAPAPLALDVDDRRATLDAEIAALDAAIEHAEQRLEQACDVILSSSSPADLPAPLAALLETIREHESNIEAAANTQAVLLAERESIG